MSISSLSPQQKEVNAQIAIKRLQEEIDRLNFRHAKNTEKEMEEEIIREAAKNIKAIIPEKFTMLYPYNDLAVSYRWSASLQSP